MTAKRRPKQVISASRRTELVAHYPDYLAERLLAIGPERVHTVVVWTKDPTNLLTHRALREALSGVGQVFVQWTITGLGGTFLEPKVLSYPRQLPLLDEVVSFVGDPRRIHWRFDPLVSARKQGERASNVDLALFSALAEPIAAAGVRSVHTSFVTMYKKVVRRLARVGVEFEEHDPGFREDFIRGMIERASGLGMEVLTCCEPGFDRRRCIDGDLLAALHPSQEPCRTDRARGQRTLCGCTASLDVGRYLPCPNRCLYCYAHPEEESEQESTSPPGRMLV